jgi:hypothetical protein
MWTRSQSQCQCLLRLKHQQGQLQPRQQRQQPKQHRGNLLRLPWLVDLLRLKLHHSLLLNLRP